MNILRTFIIGIFREAIAKKIMLTVFSLFTFLLILIIFAITNEVVDNVITVFEASGQAAYRDAVVAFEAGLISNVPMFLLIVMFIIIVSSFIPSMLREGQIDILLSKPISRPKIVFGHFIAGILLVFFSLVLILGIIWLVVSLKTGIWHFPFLYSIFWMTFIFALLYSTIIFFAFLTKSNIITIIINLFLFFPLTYMLYKYVSWINQGGVSYGGILNILLKFLYYLLPKPWDLSDITDSIVRVSAVNSYMAVYMSILFISVMLAFSVVYFNKKDY